MTWSLTRQTTKSRPRHAPGQEIGTLTHRTLRVVVPFSANERVVVTGVGLVTSVGRDRETTWRALQRGESGARRLPTHPDLPADLIAATVEDVDRDFAGQTKFLPLSRSAGSEALADARLLDATDRADAGVEDARIGLFAANQMGDLRHTAIRLDLPEKQPATSWPWWAQWAPNSVAAKLSQELRLHGPCNTYGAACASSLLALARGATSIQDDACDIAVVGGAEAIEPLMAAGFTRMGVLAKHDDPASACRPFDRHRNGFVMGEGAAMLVLERMSTAVRRGAPIYGELLATGVMTDTHHITSLTAAGSALPSLIERTIRRAGVAPVDLQLVSAHGTGTEQNDALESLALRESLGRAAYDLNVTATKSALGHLVNAAGAVEMAVTMLALRDGLSPPTLNLTEPDPACDLNCTPLVAHKRPLEHALKTSIAFGGHLVTAVARRWQGRLARDPLPLAIETKKAA